MCQKLSDFVCVSARRGNHRVWHRQGEASSDHLSAGLPGGRKKKKSARERFAARDLRAPVARATLIRKPPEMDESESRQLSAEHYVADRKHRWPWRPSQQRKKPSGNSSKTPKRGGEGADSWWGGTVEPWWFSSNHTESMKKWIIKPNKWKYARWIWVWHQIKVSHQNTLVALLYRLCSWWWSLDWGLYSTVALKEKTTVIIPHRKTKLPNNIQLLQSILNMSPGWTSAKGHSQFLCH